MRPSRPRSARANACSHPLCTSACWRKSGAWVSYNGKRIGQGRANTKEFLRTNPKVANAIEAAVRANAGLIVDKMLAEPEADADGETPDEDGVLPDVDETPRKGAKAKR